MKNMRDVFNGPSSFSSLVHFFKDYDLKSFDIAWELIQSTPDYFPLLQALKAQLSKAEFGLTSTLGEGIKDVGFHARNIMPLIDLLFLVPMGNRFYNPGLPQSDMTFAYLEANEGEFLKLVESKRSKIVIGLSLQALIWRTGSSDEFSLNARGELETQPFDEACSASEFEPLQQQASPFFTLTKSSGRWTILMDPSSIKRRVELLMLHGFAGVSLYDYDMVTLEAIKG